MGSFVAEVDTGLGKSLSARLDLLLLLGVGKRSSSGTSEVDYCICIKVATVARSMDYSVPRHRVAMVRKLVEVPKVAQVHGSLFLSRISYMDCLRCVSLSQHPVRD